ncbi:MAG: hypothetical protein K2P70_10225 [Hyphomonadaceae bacterium]|nr:hypothetical protein [Hyphomonadaceae bacterium]
MHLAPGGAIPTTTAVGPFRAVIVVERGVASNWRNLVSDWLVASGCLYTVAWGDECSAWDDSVDEAARALHGDDYDDDKFVMTTWHENESIDEVFWFAGICAFHPTIDLNRIVLIDITDHDRREYLIARYAQAVATTPR